MLEEGNLMGYNCLDMGICVHWASFLKTSKDT